MQSSKKWLRVCAILLISFLVIPTVFGGMVKIIWRNDWRNVRVGEKTFKTDVGPQLENGEYYFPLRFLAEFMGHRVFWLDYEKSAVVRGQGRNLKIWMGKSEYESVGVKKKFKYPPINLRSRILVSQNFIKEEFGLATKEIEPDKDGYHLVMEIDERKLLPHAPDFTLATESGGTLNFLEELNRDDVKCILINFWSTRCLPCNKELPALVVLYDKYKDDGLQVLGVCTDSSHMDEERADLLERLGVNYPIPLDPMAETYYTWGGLGVPNMTLVNKEELIVWQHDGYSPDTPAEAEIEIRKLLGLD